MELLRPARMEDCQAVNRLAQQLYDYITHWDGRSLEYDRYPAGEFREYVDSGCLYVAEFEGKVVGYLYAYEHCRIGLDDEEYLACSIQDFCVDEAYRDRGFGKRMMHEFLDYAREQGYKTVDLDVVKKNQRAFELYRQFGFEISGYSMELHL